MNVTLAALLSVLSFAAGVPSQQIKAVEGDDVTLRCPLAPGVNLSSYTVDVTRLDLDANDNVVHVYRGGQDHLPPQMAQYKGRTTLIHKDLIRGILTLMISPVKMSDSGRYCCFAPHLTTSRVIDLTVVPKDQQNGKDGSDSGTTGPPVDELDNPAPKDPQNRTRRGDSSTTRPPMEGVTKPDNGDAAKKEPLLKTVLPSVGGCVAAAAAAVGLVLLILVKLGKIQICKQKTPSEMKEPEHEMMMPKTRATEADEGPHSTAANGLREAVV